MFAGIELMASRLSRRWWSSFLGSGTDTEKGPLARCVSQLDRIGAVYANTFRWPSQVKVERDMLRAGLNPEIRFTTVLGAKVLGAALGMGFGVVTCDIALVLGFGVCWYFLPELYLSVLQQKRQQEVQKALPRVIDLMMVATEAGLSFEGALNVVAGFSSHGPLYVEMGRVLHEIRLGKSQEDALRSLALRVDHPDVTSFVLTLIQGQKLGTSIGQILGVVAHQVRMKRASAAEAEAGKAPIKIMFPLLLFVFPALLVVLLGPVLLGERL